MNNNDTQMNNNQKILARDFYTEYRGHRVEHLDQLLTHIRESDENVPIIWTAGDSSLDNKYWFNDTVPSVPSYQSILQPPRSKPDVTYWMNYMIGNGNGPPGQHPHQRPNTFTDSANPTRYIAINGAVEASTLNIRSYCLLPQDAFIRDHIQENDVLIVSVGGNDVALLPLPCTIVSTICLMLLLPTACIEKGCILGTVPLDDYCCGCGPSLCSCFCACPPCLGYFRHLFGLRVQRYIEALTEKTKPSKILVCMIYYPDETPDVTSWANPTLSCLGYNRNPQKLQAFIRKLYSDVSSTIQVPGSQVIHVPLYRVLNGKHREDYVVAEFLLAYIFSSSPTMDGVDTSRPLSEATPSSSLIRERD